MRGKQVYFKLNLCEVYYDVHFQNESVEAPSYHFSRLRIVRDVGKAIPFLDHWRWVASNIHPVGSFFLPKWLVRPL